MTQRRSDRRRGGRGATSHRWTGTRARWLALLAALSALALVGGLAPGPAQADTPDCSLYAHCYSELQGKGTVFDGMTGTWNRAYMNSNDDAINEYFMDSEMWFSNSGGRYFVEAGLSQGWEMKLNGGQSAYELFYGWRTTAGSQDYKVVSYTGPNDSQTDSYQISHSATPGVFNVWIDGNVYATPNTGFLQSDYVQIGAEVASSLAHAHTFNMYSQGIVGSQTQNWGTQSAAFSPSGIGGVDLNGAHYQNSEWSWNTVQP